MWQKMLLFLQFYDKKDKKDILFGKFDEIEWKYIAKLA